MNLIERIWDCLQPAERDVLRPLCSKFPTFKCAVMEPSGTVLPTDFITYNLWKILIPHGDIVQKSILPSLEISTMFVGVPNHRGHYFESMVFSAGPEIRQTYNTFAEAKEGHRKLLEQYCPLEQP